MGGRRTQRKRKETSDIAVDGVEVGGNVGGEELTAKDRKKIKGEKEDVAAATSTPIVVIREEDNNEAIDNEKDGGKIDENSKKKADDANVTMLDEVKAKTMEVVEQSTSSSSKSKTVQDGIEEGAEENEDDGDVHDDGKTRKGEPEQVTLCSITGSSNEEIHDKLKELLVSNMGAKIFDMLLEDGAHSVHHLANNLNTTSSNPTFFYVWKQLLSLGVVKESPMHSEASPKPVYRLTSVVFPFGKPASAKKLASTEEGDFIPTKYGNKKKKAKAASSKDGNDSNVENEKEEGSEGHAEAPGTEPATASAASSSPTEASEVEEGEIIEAII